MSYLIQFPSLPLPHDIRSPPYVVFGLNGKDIVADLPQRIPLKLVLHFAPKFKEWVLPPPSMENLPKPVARLALRCPLISIDIRSNDIKILGLKWVINRMLEVSGATAQTIFLAHPTILASLLIHKTWLALGLPFAWIQCVSTHLLHHINYGPAVTLAEMQALLLTFPRNSDIVCAMGENIVRSYLCAEYSDRDFMAIRNWYFRVPDRRRFFRELEADYPEFAEVQRVAAKMAAVKAAASARKEKEAEEAAKCVKKLMEKNGTRNVSVEEKRERQAKDESAMRTRLRRTKSDASARSVETVIWNPPVSKEKGESVADAEELADDTDVEDNKISTVPSRLRKAKGKPTRWARPKVASPRPLDPQLDPSRYMEIIGAGAQDLSQTGSTEVQVDPNAQASSQSESSSSATNADTALAESLLASIRMSVEEVEAMRRMVTEPEDEPLATETRRDSHDSCVAPDKDAESRKRLNYMHFD